MGMGMGMDMGISIYIELALTLRRPTSGRERINHGLVKSNQIKSRCFSHLL